MTEQPYYEDDYATLYHGDCLELADVWIGCDVLLSDPPYGRNWERSPFRTGDSHIKARQGIRNDSSTDTRDNMLKLWGKKKPAITFGDLMLTPPEGTKLVAVYKKPSDAGRIGNIASVRRDCEAIYFNSAFNGTGYSGGFRSALFQTGTAMVSGSHGLVATSGGHPHSKPLDVLCDLLRLMPEGVIADPFAGGGSTLVAAKLMGRRAIGVELDERWCEVAAKRLSQGVLDFGEWTA